MSLVEKMRRAREVAKEIDGHTFTVRIPTDGEMFDLIEQLAGRPLTGRRLAVCFLVGWDLKEMDLVQGGGPELVKYDVEIGAEYLNSHNLIASQLGEFIVEQKKLRDDQIEASVKK